MQKQLPLVDTFNPSLEIWSERDMTEEESIAFFKENGYIWMKIKDKLITILDTPYKAIKYIAEFGADNKVEIFINDTLSKNKNYKLMKQMMPSKTPKVLFDYQKKYPNYNNILLSQEINKINIILAEGQYLFHGGKWFNDSVKILITTKPFSTTFSPLVALNEALDNGKAYDANGIDLFVVKVKKPQTSVFVYKNNGTFLGHEKEVLFNSGATIKLKSIVIIKTNFKVIKVFDRLNIKEKYVPIRILEIDIQ